MDHAEMTTLTLASFQQTLDQQVTLTDEQNHAHKFTVTQVRDWTSDSAPFETFSVLLASEQAIKLEQGTYQLSHSAVGNQALLCVPVSETELEVVISRERKD